MWALLRRLFLDETAGIRFLRMALLAAGQFAAVGGFEAPTGQKIMGAIMVGFGGFLGAGEKNPRPRAPGSGNGSGLRPAFAGLMVLAGVGFALGAVGCGDARRAYVANRDVIEEAVRAGVGWVLDEHPGLVDDTIRFAAAAGEEIDGGRLATVGALKVYAAEWVRAADVPARSEARILRIGEMVADRAAAHLAARGYVPDEVRTELRRIVGWIENEARLWREDQTRNGSGPDPPGGVNG